MVKYSVVRLRKPSKNVSAVFECNGYTRVLDNLIIRESVDKSLIDTFTTSILDIEKDIETETLYLNNINKEMDEHYRLYGDVFESTFPQYRRTITKIDTLKSKLRDILEDLSAVAQNNHFTYSVILTN